MVALALKSTKCARRTRHENVLSRVDSGLVARAGAAELACALTAAAPSAAASRPRIQMPWRRCTRESYAVHGRLNRAQLQFPNEHTGATWLRRGRSIRMSCKPRSPVGLVNPPAKRKCEERSRTRRLGEPSRRRRPGIARGPEAAPTNGLGAEGELIAQSATRKDRLARR